MVAGTNTIKASYFIDTNAMGLPRTLKQTNIFSCQKAKLRSPKKVLRATINVTLKDKVPTTQLALTTNALLFHQLALYQSQILAAKIHNS